MMAGEFEILGRALGWEQYPARVYTKYTHYEDECDEPPHRAQNIAVTETDDLARWLIDAINARIQQVPLTIPRPDGAVLQHGSFKLGEDEYLNQGWWYCIAYGIGSNRGVTFARSKDVAVVAELRDRLQALVASGADMPTRE